LDLSCDKRLAFTSKNVGKEVKKVNKTTKAIVMVFCILALSTVGFVNATPRTLKQVNLLYSTGLVTDDGPVSAWFPVAGNQVSDFKLKLDGNPDTWYYLDIKKIKPDLQEMEDGWFLTPPTGVAGAAFYKYWSDRGVSISASFGTWQWLMWRIIRPTGLQFPMFVLASDGAGNYDLLDGLQYAANELYPNQPPAGPLRLNGDYPKGTYTFTSDLEIHDPADFEVEISVEFK
jgi:hypothetical protein